MFNRPIRSIIAIIIVVSAGLLVVPKASYAASGVTTTVGWFSTDRDGNLTEYTSALDADWTIGNCTLVEASNPNYSYIRLTAPDSDSNATLTWGGVGRIRRSNSSGDYWRLRLRFFDADYIELRNAPQLSGDKMTVAGSSYVWRRDIDLKIGRNLFERITYVVWESSC
jgi:hypothetical protein